MKKKILSILLCGMLLLSVPLSAGAAAAPETASDPDTVSASSDGVQPRWNYINGARVTLKASGRTLTATAVFDGTSAVTSVAIYTRFQKKGLFGWSDLAPVGIPVLYLKNSATMNMDREVTSGGTYRAYTEFSAATNAGNEVVTLYSNELNVS